MNNGEKITSNENINNATQWDSLKEVEFSPDKESERANLIEATMNKIDSLSNSAKRSIKIAILGIALSAAASGLVGCANPVNINHCANYLEEYNDKIGDNDAWQVNITNEDGETISFNNDSQDYDNDDNSKAKSIEAFLWSEDDECMYHAIDKNGDGNWDALSKQDLETGKETNIVMQEMNVPLYVASKVPVMETTPQARAIMDKLPTFK